MKHATSRLLFAYWDALRGERAAPDRNDVKPGQIRHLLADTFVLGNEPPGPATFRLAGTRCSALFGRDLKDVAFDSLWTGPARAEAERMIDIVTEDTAGIVAGVLGTSAAGSRIGLELLLLPLKHGGSVRSRALGALSPASIPSWMGLVPVTSLEVQSMRVVRTDSRGEPEFRDVPRGAAETRSRFVVLEGGLAR